MDFSGNIAWVTPGHDCLCSYKYGHGAAVRPQTNNPIWDGVIYWSVLLSPWCARGNMPTGVNLNQYAGPGSCIPRHSDTCSATEFAQAQEAILWSSRCSVARRARFPLRFGWTMVTSWSWIVWRNRSMFTLHSPRVNLSFRWVTQHIASSPLTSVMCCVLHSCVQS